MPPDDSDTESLHVEVGEIHCGNYIVDGPHDRDEVVDPVCVREVLKSGTYDGEPAVMVGFECGDTHIVVLD